ncbi:Protein phosphatase PP2A regulatory subunit B [Serendipita sp. 399]|nr:Protein phosphatase PP2A regulatory subunit B [Serendipita sp. 399]
MEQEPHILFIDSYDSFTHNLVALCRQSLPGAQVHIIRNDALDIHTLLPHLASFSAIIVGPGPGSPLNPSDIGIVNEIWKVANQHILPVFGVCLGLQSLAISFGAQLKRLPEVKHGQISTVHHTGTDLFKLIGDVEAVRYHSLHVTINEENDQLRELAWARDGKENGKVIMAISHRTKPFWAVQYHPESVKTKGGGIEVMHNFWKLARMWSLTRNRTPRPWSFSTENLVGPSWPFLCISRNILSTSKQSPNLVQTRVVSLSPHTVLAIAELFGSETEPQPFVLLESAAAPGRYTIIGVLDSSSLQITYHLGDEYVFLTEGGKTRHEPLRTHDIWTWTSDYMQRNRSIGGHESIPFWGGLVGYLSYELGCDHVTAVPTRSSSLRKHPDLNLVFVERSVVIDNFAQKSYIQTIKQNDDAWLEETAHVLTNQSNLRTDMIASSNSKRAAATASISYPDKSTYLSRIDIAKEHLAVGNSYELCLTAQTRVSLSLSKARANDRSSWDMYKHLRSVNPAPYSAYIRLHPTTVLSSSPERFLSFTRPPESRCQLRPIKGTLRKGPNIARADAERGLAGNIKEVAENLMIVDLIRHDLHGVLGENVNVTQLCGIEEYETVWQMVSVIEGKPSPPSLSNSPSRLEENEQVDLGWKVLRHSLPPGSMTGAPKKRSVEILRELEGGPRGVYSGVLGYWDVGGGGDWSVVIRSCFKLDPLIGATVHVDEGHEEWSLGAGGAITALSDRESEWEEMLLKLQSVLRIFHSENDSL